MTPLIARIEGGSDAGAAMISAAEDDKPERPDAAESEVRRGTDRSIVGAAHPMRRPRAPAVR